jgi:hypothetical protein
MGGYSFDTDDVSQILEIEPTAVMNGNTRPGDELPAVSSWEYSSQKVLDDNIDIYYMTRMLIKEIEPAKDNIIIAAERYNLVPKIVVKLVISSDKDEAVPDIGISTRNLRFLSEIGAFVDINIKKR